MEEKKQFFMCVWMWNYLHVKLVCDKLKNFRFEFGMDAIVILKQYCLFKKVYCFVVSFFAI